MRTRKIVQLLLIGILIASAILVFHPTPAHAANLIVNILTDENDHSCVDGDCSLRDAVEVANSGDTITFSVTGTIILTGTHILINKDLIVTGPGSANLTVSGNDASRIFYTNSGITISVTGMTITNGKPNPTTQTGCGGGAIYNNAFLTLDDVIITNSDATLLDSGTCLFPRGGGIVLFGLGSLTITNSTISNNKTYSLGGGVYFASTAGTLTLTDVTISGNISTDYSGGGLDVNQANGTVKLERVHIYNNTAGNSSSSGSGLYIDKNGAGAPTVTQIDIIDSDIYNNNNSNSNGNGITIYGAGTVNILGSTVSNNASRNGGGVYIGDSNVNTIVNITNSTIAGNSSTGSGKGGGIYVAGSGANDPVVNIKNSTIAGNTATSGTGGIYSDVGPSINMSNTILANNVDVSSSSEDCDASINSQDYNLIEVLTGCILTGTTTHNLSLDPNLGSLADNGGLTQTMALLTGSAAIDAGDDSICAATPVNNSAQNGVARPAGMHCDVGAYELTGGDTTGVFRPSNGVLFMKNANTSGFADIAINYGIPADYPVTGDWDGNNTATIGVYRNGQFLLRNSNTLGFADLAFAFGQPGDQPIAGDWDGDGIDTIGVFRPTTGQFLLRNTNSAGASDASFFLGNAGDVGIAGDWNGDGMDTTGVFRPSNGVLFMKNANTSGFADIAINYGIPGDQPVTGDWDNDGIDTIGVYRNGQFLLRNSNTLGFADIVFALGIPGDMPIAGNWDGIP